MLSRLNELEQVVDLVGGSCRLRAITSFRWAGFTPLKFGSRKICCAAARPLDGGLPGHTDLSCISAGLEPGTAGSGYNTMETFPALGRHLDPQSRGQANIPIDMVFDRSGAVRRLHLWSALCAAIRLGPPQ